jgi:hypothetical protein
MSALSQPEWRRECLLSANRQLEKVYQRKPTPCVALQISRNYRLLLVHYEQPDIKQMWQMLSKRWWEIYCRHRKPTLSLHEFPAL